jgi:Flp pilus assembly protein TadD
MVSVSWVNFQTDVRRMRQFFSILSILLLAACSAGGLGAPSKGNPYAPGVAKGDTIDGLTVGHRLMEAGEYELALDAFGRAGLEQGMTSDVLSGLGSASLGLRRLNQAEKFLRRAVEKEDVVPEAWNNLGVVLMEKGDSAEAAAMFQRAFALDNGNSDAIRENLRLALAKTENLDYDPSQEQEYRLIRRGSSDYLIRPVSG